LLTIKSKIHSRFLPPKIPQFLDFETPPVEIPTPSEPHESRVTTQPRHVEVYLPPWAVIIDKFLSIQVLLSNTNPLAQLDSGARVNFSTDSITLEVAMEKLGKITSCKRLRVVNLTTVFLTEQNSDAVALQDCYISYSTPEIDWTTETDILSAHFPPTSTLSFAASQALESSSSRFTELDVTPQPGSTLPTTTATINFIGEDVEEISLAMTSAGTLAVKKTKYSIFLPHCKLIQFRTRRKLRPVIKSTNNYGRAGKERCHNCRKWRQKVFTIPEAPD
jgi:hypothetical protein